MQLVLDRFLTFNACSIDVKLSCIYHDAVSIESFTRWHLCYVIEEVRQVAVPVFGRMQDCGRRLLSMIALLMLMKVLRLFHFLVKFGYYSSEDIKTLLKPLINLLNGKHDKPFTPDNERGGDAHRV